MDENKTLFCDYCLYISVISNPEIIHTILSTVAERDGVPPGQLDPPLAAVVDPDALTAVLRDTVGYVRFRYNGYVVTVDADGTVTVEE
ncbi:HalOD1 output domain-containing protein [Halobaculum halobium]|uniref:HalOD1 output domain-containing protein n=1 Tax=Halobaculum halobium TaxID=3032281 RepID=A0ABD5T630_9EURY|nr:HalOD1 output domain-containing protein [Halobaculum sp. SYNS20]